MAQVIEPVAGQKRGAGRPSKTDTPAAKKARPSTSVLPSPLVPSPEPETPTTEKRTIRLPSKIFDSKPLPARSAPQPPTLSTDEYQSIAASAVLEASLDRSRLRWISEGIFERYWTKPESGRNARAPPPNNPEVKWQKHKGECRIRVEPHIFTAEMYVEERPRPTPPKASVAPSAYGQPYRPQQYQQPQRTLPPINQSQQQQLDGRTLPTINNMTTSTSTPPARQASSQPPDKKANPDPVISMLASRASSDPELKALMKEVATGNANQAQLKIFQRHIDELGEILKKQRAEEAEHDAKEAKQAAANGNVIQYDAPAESKPATTEQQAQPPKQQYAPPAPVYQQQQNPYVPPPPASQPVILAFTSPGASEDRFLFPRHSILESLSPQHVLASFIVTRTRRTAADPTGLDAGTEYWQPVTILIEVQYGKEFLLDCVRKWVKPAEEVRKWMKEFMERCTRAPETFLALRLPWKGSAMAEGEESVAATRHATPVVIEEREKEKGKSGVKVKYFKKSTAKSMFEVAKKPEGTVQKPAAEAQSEKDVEKEALSSTADGSKDGVANEPAATETGRPRRTTRKSVRMSEG